MLDRTWTLTAPLAMTLLVVAANPTACGGKVVVDDEDAASGTGIGGAGAGSSSSTIPSGGSPTTSSSSSASASSTGGSTVVCEDEGCSDCFGCANDGPCAAELQACAQSPVCEAFQQCTVDCQDIGPEPCLDQCAGFFPEGYQLYGDWVQCSACVVCPSSCAVPFSFFCDVQLD